MQFTESSEFLQKYTLSNRDTINPETDNIEIPLNYSECTAIVGDDYIDFIQDENKWILRHEYPLYLFSYGGSGNTVTRLLLEYTTNIWTGSIYHQRGLTHQGFEGEKTCKNVMVVKAHPEHQKPRKIAIKASFLKECLEYYHKIGSYEPIYSNMSAIFIIRDPWKAMFALYQFHHGTEPGVNGHIRHSLIDKWNGTHFAKFVRSSANEWMKTFKIMELFEKYNFDYIVVKFESLLNLSHDSKIAINEMNKMLIYLYNDEYYTKNRITLTQRMKCIFNQLINNNYQRFGKMHRTKPDPNIHVTFEMAFKFVIDNYLDIICSVWDIIEKRAISYGYQNIESEIQC